MRLLQKILAILLWPLRFLIRIFIQRPVAITAPFDGDCKTRNAAGDLVVPVTTTGTFDAGYTYVFEVYKKVDGVWRKIGEYPYGGTLTVPGGDLGDTPNCVDVDIRITRIDPQTGARKFIAAVTVNLCPDC